MTIEERAQRALDNGECAAQLEISDEQLRDRLGAAIEQELRLLARRCADSVRDKAITHMEAATRLKREGVQDWALIDRFEAKGGALMRAFDELREFALAGREGEGEGK